MDLTRGALKNRIPAQAGRAIDAAGSTLNTVRLEDTILLASVPRSGSTWAMDLLATLPGYKSIYEPLHPDWYAPVRRLATGPRPAVAPNETHASFRGYLEAVFSGRVSGAHADYDLSPGAVASRLRADKLVVKSVRLARCLAWIVSAFELRQVYLLVRHPCAVVASQRRTGIRGHFTPPDEELDRDAVVAAALDDLGDEVPAELVERVETVRSEVEVLALLWAVDHALALARASPDLTVVAYEHLLTGGPEALSDLFAPLGVDTPSAAREAYGEPSHTTRGEVRSTVEAQQERWAKQLTREEGQRVVEIVGWFGFEGFSYSSADYPVPEPGEDGPSWLT